MSESITVSATNDLNGQVPQLAFPSNQLKTNADTIEFSWAILSGATDHRIELTDLNASSQVLNNLVSGGQYQWLTDEGYYQWGVQALNANSSSQFAYRELTIDKSPPSAPVQTSPNDGSTLNAGSVSFSWSSGVDNLTTVTDTLYIENVDSATVLLVPAAISGYTTTLSAGNYSWKLKSANEVGLSTNSAQVFQFDVQ